MSGTNAGVLWTMLGSLATAMHWINVWRFPLGLKEETAGFQRHKKGCGVERLSRPRHSLAQQRRSLGNKWPYGGSSCWQTRLAQPRASSSNKASQDSVFFPASPPFFLFLSGFSVFRWAFLRFAGCRQLPPPPLPRLLQLLTNLPSPSVSECSGAST
jgi:hypothetical protein